MGKMVRSLYFIENDPSEREKKENDFDSINLSDEEKKSKPGPRRHDIYGTLKFSTWQLFSSFKREFLRLYND